MSDPLGIQFGCIGCGAMNPIGAEVCSGCGHRFAGPDVVSTTPSEVPPVRRPLSPDRFYEPPQAPIARAPASWNEPPRAPVAPPTTFRIGTMMVLIAVIAVCLGAFAADISLGVIATLGLLPATIRTILVSGRREAEGRPMDLGEQIATFCMTIISVVLIVASSAVAFCGTCLPIGAGTNSIGLALGAGGLAAVGMAVFMIRAMLKAARRRERERDQIRWY